MRDILDLVKPSELRKAFRAIHASAQRGKVLGVFAIFNNRHLLSIDGTGLHSSTKVKCPQCSVMKHRNGEIEYYHQSLAAVIVHPDQKPVLPLDLEPIVESDGDTRNDCERNACCWPLINCMPIARSLCWRMRWPQMVRIFKH